MVLFLEHVETVHFNHQNRENHDTGNNSKTETYIETDLFEGISQFFKKLKST
jgi:hypothetical protein